MPPDMTHQRHHNTEYPLQTNRDKISSMMILVSLAMQRINIRSWDPLTDNVHRMIPGDLICYFSHGRIHICPLSLQLHERLSPSPIYLMTETLVSFQRRRLRRNGCCGSSERMECIHSVPNRPSMRGSITLRVLTGPQRPSTRWLTAIYFVLKANVTRNIGLGPIMWAPGKDWERIQRR